MKKKFILSIVVLSTLILAACSGGQASDATENTGQAASGTPGPGAAPGAGGERKMPLAMQLALGTFKLEDTGHPISAEQASNLLPLWKAMRSLSNSETYAAQELEAVIRQIQDILTSEQIADIESISFSDMQTLTQKFGLDAGIGGGFGNMSPEMQTTMEARRQSGQMPGGGGFPGGGPGGGFPGEGGPPGQGGTGGGQLSQTPQAGRGGGTVGVNPALLEAVIEFLQAKIE